MYHTVAHIISRGTPIIGRADLQDYAVAQGLDDAIFDRLLLSALDYAEAETKMILRPCEAIIKLDCAQPVLVIDKRLINAITSITYYDENEVQQTLSSTLYQLHQGSVLQQILIDWPTVSFSRRLFPVTIVLDLGYTAANVPERALQLVRYLVADMYEKRANPVYERTTAADRLIRSLKVDVI